MLAHREPDNLEREVKRALGSITMNKASGGDEIPVEIFQILNDEACRSAALIRSANLESSAVATRLEKASFHSNPKEGQHQRSSNYCTTALIPQASKVMLKILQARLQQYVN